VEVTRIWWVGTLVTAFLLLMTDLILTSRQKRRPTAREAALGVAFYTGTSVAFAVLLWVSFGPRYGGEFAAGWLTEYSLSVDNLFVFMVLMARFAVPPPLQLRVLTIGIVLALVLRGALIAAGSAALAAFSWVFYLFGAFLLWTAWKLLREGPGGKEAEESGKLVTWLQHRLGTARHWADGRLTVVENGRRVLTPMLFVMVAIGMTDVLFALDSIPAIFGLTKEPFLVVSANAFALMGLRQLYFLVEGLLDRLVHLSHGLALVLGFIAVKLVLEALHDNDLPFLNGGRPVGWAPVIPVWASLCVVLGILAVTAATSMVSRRRATSPVQAAREGTVAEPWPRARPGRTENAGDRTGQRDRTDQPRDRPAAARNGTWKGAPATAFGTTWPLTYGRPGSPSAPSVNTRPGAPAQRPTPPQER
jgi:tellurite resistance protein TerC